MLEEHVNGSCLYTEGLFNREQVRIRVQRHVGGASDESAVLWPLLTLGLWLEPRRAR
jgi:hypothetical protein